MLYMLISPSMIGRKLLLFLFMICLFTPAAFAGVTDSQVSDLVQNFKSGNKPVLFVFCREDRSFHCLSVIRDTRQKLMLSSDATHLWSLPLLGASDDHRAYNQSHGETPQGIFEMTGVMPIADQNADFGQFRRIILNFLPGNSLDQAALALLPTAFAQSSWWKEASFARDMGRSEFRIHGVGVLNSNPNDPSYPFVPTWGCLTTREGLYDGVQYQDQRILLDSLMTAQGLAPSFENETLISGYVVVLNINGIRLDVQPEELQILQTTTKR
jgi:hypothetical protein